MTEVQLRPIGAAGWALLLVFGVLFAFFFSTGVWRLADHAILVAHAERTSGEVVALKSVYWRPGHGTARMIGGNAPDIHPVVEFIGSDGVVRRITARQGSYPAAHEVHDRVEVIYPENRPEAAVVFGWIELWLEPVMFIGLGALPLLLLLRRAKRRTR